MGKIKINLNAIKVNTTLSEDTNTSKSNDNITEKSINSIKPSENKEIKKEINNKKIHLDSIKKINLEEKIEEKTDNKNSIKIEKKEKPTKKLEKSLFNNYESIFEKEKTSILDHIKKLKQIPKTNIVLLSILIAITITGIGVLFIINPKIHNLENYKTSIIDTYNVITNKTGSGIINKRIKKEINKGGYIYNIEIEKILGKNVYIYNGQYYNSLDKLNIVINKDIENRKQIKLVKILKNSFSK